MAHHEMNNRRIQVLTFLDTLTGEIGDTLSMIFSEKLFLLSPGRGDAKHKLRIGAAFEENPKHPRNEVRSGTPVTSGVFCLGGDALNIGRSPQNYSNSKSRRFILSKTGVAMRSMGSLVFLFVCSFAVLCCVSCGGSSSSSTSKETITVNITPTTAIVGLGATEQFTCLESGDANTNVTWEVDDVVGGNSTTGTISTKGLYTAPTTFSTPSTVTVTCIAQANGMSSANVPVTLSSGVTVSLAPASVNLQFGQTQQFTAAVNGSSNTAVTWQAGGVSGGNSTYGTISSSGLYTAPSTAATTPLAVTVTAVAKVDSSRSGTASIIVHGGIGVSVTPTPVTVPTFGSQQFTASVTGTPNTGITWEVNGIVGGSSKTGTISTTGLYSAPNSVPTTSSNSKSVGATVTVTAVSQADSTASGNVMVTILPSNQAAQKAPVSLGLSGGNANDNGTSGGSSTCCSGTLGSLVLRGGNQYILSASHVLARSDAGSAGDAIIQPGLIDSGCSTASTTTVANLSQFVNLETPPATTPFVDAALAQVVSGQVNPLGTILELGGTTLNGQPTDAPPHAGAGMAPSIGLAIAKSGRSTGLTCSTITAINAVVNVQYQKGCGTGPSFTATFSDLVIVGDQSFSADGDSGSLLVTQSGADPVALIVASADTETVAAPVSDVLAALADPSTAERPVFVGTASTHAVAGCSLPGPQLTAALAKAQIAVSPTAEILQAAAVARDAGAAALLAYPQVHALGVGPSLDEPGNAAILLVVPNTASLAGLPSQVNGQRTRIVQTDDIPHEGVLSSAESAALIQTTSSANSVTALTDGEVARARTVQSAHATDLLKKEGIQGVAITSSADNPNEAALLVLVVRGSKHDTIPAVIDGLRTRIQETSAFQSGSRSAKSNLGCRLESSIQKSK
jgi:hypothetical protein